MKEKSSQKRKTDARSAICAVALMLVAAFICLSVAGCGQKNRTVRRISVVNGFRQEYALDQPLDLANAYLLADTDNGQERVPMAKATVTGFDSGIVGTRTMTISYGGATTTWNYTVTDPLPVDTHTRIVAKLQDGVLIVSITNLDIPLRGIRLTLDMPQSESEPVFTPHANFTLERHTYYNGWQLVLAGTQPITQNGVILQVQGEFRSAKVQNILLSDGGDHGDYQAPDYLP